MEIERLQQWIKESNNIVFFGGAGVSTESGIPDFRSVDGLYNQSFEYDPETIISRSFFERDPEYFYRFYREKMMPLDYEPNVTHKVLAELEDMGKLKAVITQNIDGLHQKAGSQCVHELHGSVWRNYCTRCGASCSAEFVKYHAGIPRCSCGGVFKPDVVLYEEPLNNETVQSSILAIGEADMLIIGGTSLVVYPAAGLIDYYHGDKLVLINKAPTSRDSLADLVISGAIGEVLSQIKVN